MWDPLVRIFHWSLVLAFTVTYMTGDEENSTHVYAGYAVLGLISFRVFWGLVGSKYALFSDFIYSPATVFRYLKGLLACNPKHYIGHNPAGGWMVILMLITLFVVSWTGLKVYAIEEGKGPLASNYPEVSIMSIAHADDDDDDDEEEEEEEERDDDRYEYRKYQVERGEDHGNGDGEEEHREYDSDSGENEFWEELHEAVSYFMLLLVVLHITGVIIAGKMHDENLVKAMITGYKKK